MLQEVLNYQHDIMLKQTAVSAQSNNRFQNDRNTHRYGLWKLHDTVQRNTHRWIDYKIKWIGDQNYSHALALFYCVLQGCLTDDSENVGKEMFLRFKYSLYQESKQVLNIMEQKIFIQHLGLIEDSKNIGQFLKKSTHLQTILIKLFSSRCAQMARKHLKTNSSIKQSKMEELQWYSALFPFCTFVVLQEKCSSLVVNKANFLIVQEKDCFFIVDEQSNHKFQSCRISEISTRKKIKTEVYGHGLEYIDSLKSFDMLDSKHQGNFVDEKTKKGFMIKSQSKQYLTGPNSDEKPNKISLSNQIQTLIHENNGNENRRTFFMKDHKKMETQLQKQRKFEDLRGSINDKKILVTFGSPKITSERASISKEKNKSMSKKQSYKMLYSIPSQIPEIVQRERVISTGPARQDFIYHSLNPQNFPQLKKEDIPQKYSGRIPKFLSKRTQQTIPYTFSNSPVKDLRQTPTKNIPKKQNKQKQKRQPKMSLTHQAVSMPSFAFSSLEDIKDAIGSSIKPSHQ